MIQFDNNGCAINVGLQTVHASGFHVGDIVLRSDQFTHRWTAHLRGALFEVTFIGGDGSVSLTQLGISGDRTPHVTQHDIGDFLNGFKKTEGMNRPKNSALPEYSSRHADMVNMKLISMIGMGLTQIMHMHASEGAVLMLQPATEVITSSAISKDKMLLIPFTSMDGISLMKDGEEANSDIIGKIAIDDAHEHTFTLKKPNETKAQAVAMFWHVKAIRPKGDMESDPHDAVNMRLDHVTTNVAFKPQGKVKAIMGKVTIPVLKLMDDVPANTILRRKNDMTMKAKKRGIPNLDLDKHAENPERKKAMR